MTNLLFGFQGRANRAKFWLVALAIFVVEAILFAVLGSNVAMSDDPQEARTRVVELVKEQREQGIETLYRKRLFARYGVEIFLPPPRLAVDGWPRALVGEGYSLVGQSKVSGSKG